MESSFARSVAALAAALAAGGALGGTYTYRPPSPSGEVLYARAEVSWQVWSPAGLAVRRVTMKLDRQPVEAEYDADVRRVVHRPTRPLAPGLHRAECTVDFGEFEAHRDWTFTIREDAVRDLPPPGQDAVALTEAVRLVRQEAGLGAARAHPALCAAAALQTQLLLRTGRFDHIQDAGAASDPGRRARLYGYSGGVSELLALHHGTPDQAVRSLFAAPYHRVPLLTPGSPDLGASASREFTTLLLGDGSSTDVRSPRPGATRVPREWDGNESPDPMRGTGLTGPFGYPVVLALFSAMGEWSLVDARLTLAGKSVACTVRHRGNDPFAQQAVILIPHAPLAPRSLHRATVSVMGSGGLATHKWEFTTAD